MLRAKHVNNNKIIKYISSVCPKHIPLYILHGLHRDEYLPQPLTYYIYTCTVRIKAF